jgi:predicted dienelactone hydrolase
MHRLVSLLLIVAAALTAQSTFAADFGGRAMPGPDRFSVSAAEWRDAARDRVVPVKIYAPEGNGLFPVLLFSHGLGGSRDAGGESAEHWASHGYLVLALQHPGSDASL